MKIFEYTIFFEPLEEGGFNVIVPAIPEICTFGDSLEQAREMAEDAIKCFLESAIELGEDIPKDVSILQEPKKESLSVKLESAF